MVSGSLIGELRRIVGDRHVSESRTAAELYSYDASLAKAAPGAATNACGGGGRGGPPRVGCVIVAVSPPYRSRRAAVNENRRPHDRLQAISFDFRAPRG